MTAIVQALLGELNLTPENDISNAASSFTDVIKGYVRTIQDNASMKNMERENEILNALYKAFFEYSVSWAAVERGKSIKIENHPEAAKLKKTAADALDDLQKNITRFVLAYTHIDRCSGYVHNEMQKNEHKFTGDNKNFKWSSDTGTVLRRYQKERNELRASHAILSEALKALEAADVSIEDLGSASVKIHGKTDGPKLITSLRSNLRMGEFANARKVLAKMTDSKKKFTLDKKAIEHSINTIKTKGEVLVSTLEKAQDHLRSPDGKLLLSVAEINVVLSSQQREIEQKSKYIDKYHQPYMENKLKSLGHLREKLLVFGSIEGLTTLYMRMMRGMAQPMPEMKDVREYEAEVINNVNYILKGQFQEISNIEKWTDEAMSEFYEAMAGFEEAA